MLDEVLATGVNNCRAQASLRVLVIEGSKDNTLLREFEQEERCTPATDQNILIRDTSVP